MSEIVERLRLRSESWETADGAPMYGPDAVLDRQAADEIERLNAEVERLRGLIAAWADAEAELERRSGVRHGDPLHFTLKDSRDALRKAVGR